MDQAFAAPNPAPLHPSTSARPSLKSTFFTDDGLVSVITSLQSQAASFTGGWVLDPQASQLILGQPVPKTLQWDINQSNKSIGSTLTIIPEEGRKRFEVFRAE
jgi:hypothetical protein